MTRSIAQVEAMIQAIDNEFEAGDINAWNYKDTVRKVLGLAYDLAVDVAELEKRVVALEARTNVV